MSVNASLVIRNGTIIDGTGSPAYLGDVAMDGELITAVGSNLQVLGAPQEIDAKGLFVAPGWVDPHTHYDAQCTWDPLLTPSANCGVTTAIMGNCGVGFAPCQKELRPFLLDLMEAVEDIPGTALYEGIQWDWETFPEYMDSLAKKQFACDVAVMVGHGGVRTWVMGKRANVSDMPGGPEKDPVTDEEIEKIFSVVREATAAGALGFSTSRLLLHRDNRGILTPGALASKKEMERICDAVSEGGGGVFEMSSDFSSYDDIPYHKMDVEAQKAFRKSEFGWMAGAMSKHDNLRVTFGVGADGAPFFSKWAGKVSQWPGQCVVQLSTRPQAIHMHHAGNVTPFTTSRSYQQAKRAAQGDVTKLVEMLKEPGRKQAILADMEGFEPAGQGLTSEQYKKGKFTLNKWMLSGDVMYPWTDTYEPAQDQMVPNLAKARGVTPLEVMYDLLLDQDGPHAGILWRPLFGYQGNLDKFVESLEYDHIIPGFDDAGAHGTILTDATTATTNLFYFGQRRQAGNGRTLPLERIVKVQTKDAAEIFGLTDRGVLKPGYRADINVIDLDRMKVTAPFWANDLPTNAGRWVQYTEGYRATILRGVVTFENDRHTGLLPGRLVRNELGLGVQGMAKVQAARTDEHVEKADLKDYAVELSRDGGGSAVARVLRDDLQSKL